MIMDDNYEELAGRQQCEAGTQSRDTDEASSSLIIEGDIQVEPRREKEKVGDAWDVVDRRDVRRWPNGIIPYVISEEVRDNRDLFENVCRAISEWGKLPILTFKETDHQPVLANGTSKNNLPNDYVEFVIGEGCSSFVGRKGGRQIITLCEGCSYGNVLHEIGHTIGLYHTNARNDRDCFIEVSKDNVEDGMLGQFECQVKNGIDVLGYDYDSVMHYPAHAFGREENGKRAVTIKTRGGQPIGQRKYLSYGDMAAVRWMYGSDDYWIAGSTGRYDSEKVDVEILKSGELRLIKEVDGREIRRDVIPCNSVLKSLPAFAYDSKNDSTVIFVVAGEASRDVLQFTKLREGGPTGGWESTRIATSSVSLVGGLIFAHWDLHGQGVLFATTADGGVAKIAKGQVANLGGPPPNCGKLACSLSGMAGIYDMRPIFSSYHIFLLGEGGRLLHLHVVYDHMWSLMKAYVGFFGLGLYASFMATFSLNPLQGVYEACTDSPVMRRVLTEVLAANYDLANTLATKWTDLGFPHKKVEWADPVAVIRGLTFHRFQNVFIVYVANASDRRSSAEVKYFFNRDPSENTLEVLET